MLSFDLYKGGHCLLLSLGLAKVHEQYNNGILAMVLLKAVKSYIKNQDLTKVSEANFHEVRGKRLE